MDKWPEDYDDSTRKGERMSKLEIPLMGQLISTVAKVNGMKIIYILYSMMGNINFIM